MSEQSFPSVSLNRLAHPRTKTRPYQKLLLTVLAAFGFTASMPALGQLSAPTYVSGTAVANITVTFSVAPPSGSTVSCSLSLSSNDARGPADSQTISANVSGSTASCPITMYYRWRLTTPAEDTMTIAYSVVGPTQTSSGLVNIIPMPADGSQLGPMNIGVTQ